jgi:hypothetical protein
MKQTLNLFYLKTTDKVWISIGREDRLVDLALSWQTVTVKFFQVISQVKWVNGEQTNMSRTISVLIFSVVTWLGFQSVVSKPVGALCSLLPTSQWRLLGGIECPLLLSSLHVFFWSFFEKVPDHT